MKDNHNVILILVSSSKFNSLFRRLIKISVSIVSSFLPEIPSSLNYSIAKLRLNHRKVSTLFFSSFFSCDHSFVVGVLHGGSTWWFIKDLFPSRSVHQDSFQVSSSILHLAIRSAIRSILSFEVVLCHFDNFFRASWFASCQEWDS